MLIFENKTIDILNLDSYQEGLEITSCIINKIEIAGCNFSKHVKISNCNIGTFIGVGAWFEEGLMVENSIFLNQTTFEAGGHNKSGFPIFFQNNIFRSFVSFFDCQYSGLFIFKDNLVLNGSNLLGNADKPFSVLFKEGNEIINNMGILDSDGIDY